MQFYRNSFSMILTLSMIKCSVYFYVEISSYLDKRHHTLSFRKRSFQNRDKTESF